MTSITNKRSPQTQEALSLYEEDFLLWSEDTAAKLKARDFEHLDLENLIEEVECLGRSDRKELLNRLAVIFEHLLKRLYVQLPQDYNGWERTIRTQRTKLEFLLKSSPSLNQNGMNLFKMLGKVPSKQCVRNIKMIPFPIVFPIPLMWKVCSIEIFGKSNDSTNSDLKFVENFFFNFNLSER